MQKMKVNNIGLTGNVLTVILNEPSEALEKLDKAILKAKEKNQPLEVDISKEEKKRSLNANNYLWALCGELAKKINLTPIEVYRKAIREAGTTTDMQIKVIAYDDFAKLWRSNGLGWFTDVIYKYSNGRDMDIRVYYGSSSYDVSQMKRLLDYVVADCEEHGIETKDSAEMEALLTYWDEEFKRKNKNENNNSDN